jgi:UDP-N-acetylmuramoyl-L-alanyl-D-glutamate--2,6-diaminopimelate ligase
MAKSGDCIMLMGKGHEGGQEINGVITPFDDRIELLNSIRQAAK